MTEPPAARLASPTGNPIVRPSWRTLYARPESVAIARSFARTSVFGLPYDDYEIGLIASEIVTNAIRHGCSLHTWPDDVQPISIQMTATTRYAHLLVTDPDHRPIGGLDEGGLTAERGRGLSIVDELATLRWIEYFEHGKAVHVLIAAPGVTLTSNELTSLRIQP